MKRVVNILSITSSIIAAIVIICTFLTSYQFFYIGRIFDSYFPVQIIIAITMATWAIRFWLNEHGSRKIMYSLFSAGIAIIFICFTLGTIR